MKTLAQTAAACLLTLCIAGLARSQQPLSQSANLAPFPYPDPNARTNEWSFTLEPNQMATYTVNIASSDTAPAPDNRVYNFQSSSYAVLPSTNINTIWVWTVSGSGQNYVCQVANTHWQEAETIVTISCTWASVQGAGSGGGGAGQPPGLIHGEAKGIALHKWGQLVATSDIAIEGAPEYLCVNETITLRSWLVTNDFPFVNPAPITSDWVVEPVGTNGGNGQFQPTTGDEVLFIPTSPGHVRVTATESQYGINSGTVEFIIYEVQSILAIPMGAAGYQNLLPEPVWIGAGGLDSDAHKADVTINVLPPVSGIPIEVWLERGIGHTNSARLVMSGQTAVGGLDSVDVLTGPGGSVSGTLTSSDALDTCIIHACQKQTNIVFNWVTQFDPETDWEVEPGFLPVPGVLTNRVLFRHHRGPSTNAPWKPFYNHQIRFFVEKVEWIDTNGVLQVIVNTPDNPSTNVNEWAIFDSPNTTDADGWVTAKLTVFDRPELYRVTMVAYDWNVWSDPPAEPQPMGMMTLMSQPPVDERSSRAKQEPQYRHVVWIEFIEDNDTSYNFSPALGETAQIKVRKHPEGNVSGFMFKMEIVRLLNNGARQLIDILDVNPSSSTSYDVARVTDFSSLLLTWNGIPGVPGFAGPPSNPPQATGPDVFEGVNEDFNRLLPAVTLGQPAPPPLYYARSVIVESGNPNNEYHVAYHPIYVPQVVKLKYDDDAVQLLRSPLYDKNDPEIVLYEYMENEHWEQFLTEHLEKTQSLFDEQVNIRIVGPEINVQGEYSVVKMEIEYINNPTNVFGVANGDFPNSNPSDIASIFAFSHRIEFQDTWTAQQGFNSFDLPLEVQEIAHAFATVTAHEIGHLLGLVEINVLGGTNEESIFGLWHNDMSWTRGDLMNPFNKNFQGQTGWLGINRLGREGQFQWKALNREYLEFVLPK